MLLYNNGLYEMAVLSFDEIDGLASAAFIKYRFLVCFFGKGFQSAMPNQDTTELTIYGHSIQPPLLCLFLLLYVPCQQLWSLRDGQFT